MTSKSNNDQFNAISLIIFLWQKKTPIIILTSIAAILSIIASLLIEEKYKSEVILFPAAASSISHDLLSTNIAKKEIMKLGEDEEVEQLLQVLQSDEIRNRIIEKYNLMQHYDIDIESRYPYTALHKEFSSNIKFTPTKFMSVNISVLDKDPKMAAQIANDISSLVDTIRIKMQRERALEALALVEKEYFTLRDEIKANEDSLSIIRSHGIVDYESQAEALNTAYGLAILEGNKTAIDNLQKRLNIVAKYGGAYVSLRDYLLYEKEQLSDLKALYSQALVDATQALPTKFVVNAAVEAEKKSYPVRWLIVVMSTFSAFILSIIIVLLFDSISKYIKEEN